MNHDLMKIHHWLLTSTFKSRWFEKNIKLQIILLLSWFIYPDYRKKTSMMKLLATNKIIVTLIIIFFVWSSTLFTFGRLTTNDTPIIIKNKTIINSFEKIDFECLKPERKYYEYLAHSKYEIDNYDNLQKLPDEVFFTIISEIKKYDLPPSIFFRLLDQESNYLYVTNKNSGANGYGQIMPSTKKLILNQIGSTKHERIDNIRISAYHLRKQYDIYYQSGTSDKESWLKSLTDYNGGSIRLAKDNMINFHRTF